MDEKFFDMRDCFIVIVNDWRGRSVIRCAPTSMGGVTMTARGSGFRVSKRAGGLGVADVFRQLEGIWPYVVVICAEAYRHASVVGTPMFYRYTSQGPHRAIDIDYTVNVYGLASDSILSFAMTEGRLFDLYSASIADSDPDYGRTLAWIKTVVHAGRTVSRAFDMYRSEHDGD